MKSDLLVVSQESDGDGEEGAGDVGQDEHQLTRLQSAWRANTGGSRTAVTRWTLESFTFSLISPPLTEGPLYLLLQSQERVGILTVQSRQGEDDVLLLPLLLVLVVAELSIN